MRCPNHACPALDPITLEIFWNRLISAADEAATGLLRTAFSTIVRESNDFATVLMDRNGDSVSENTGGLASFSCILPRTTKDFLATFPVETWKPGDCVVTNDPWLATGHLPDFTVVTPASSIAGRLVGFRVPSRHSPDVGGALWSADCREIFEEGIRIPPSHLLRGGQWNQQMLDILLGNVRVPRQVLGDLEAQIAADRGRRAPRRGIPRRHRPARSAGARPRAACARRPCHAPAIADVPDGTWRSEIEADGFDDEHDPHRLRRHGRRRPHAYRLRRHQPQIDRGINCVMNYTHAYSVYPVKCALDPFTPRNEGQLPGDRGRARRKAPS